MKEPKKKCLVIVVIFFLIDHLSFYSLNLAIRLFVINLEVETEMTVLKICNGFNQLE